MRPNHVLAAVLCLCLPARTSATSPAEDKARAKTLYRQVGIDTELDLFLAPVDRAMVQRLLEASGAAGHSTQLTALLILRKAVANRAIADQADVARVAETVARLKAEHPSDFEVVMALDQIAWHLQIQSSEQDKRRGLLERPFSERSQKVAPYQVAAIEYLVAMGKDGAEVVGRALESYRCTYQETCELALRRIAIQEQVFTLGASSQSVDLLLDAMETRNLRFRRWVVGQLSKLRPVSNGALEQLAADPAIDDLVRHAAKTALQPGAGQLAW